MSPESLYNALIRLQRFVEDLEASTSEDISWPLVNYCHRFWESLLGESAQVFYSVTREHNYTINSVSERLKLLLKPVASKTDVEALLGSKPLYCLQLASLEEENLPLYAIIGHEFGHAFWYANQDYLVALLLEELSTLLPAYVSGLATADIHAGKRRVVRTLRVIKSIATELFCDLVGWLISGPAFILSLHEMTWGSNKSRWNAVLTPIDAQIVAYPSPDFRLYCLQRQQPLTRYETEAAKAFSHFTKPNMVAMGSYCSSLPCDHGGDTVSVGPDADPDSALIATVIRNNLANLKLVLEKFLSRCDAEFLPAFRAKPEFMPASAENVAALIERLENNILPNIIPDTTLLGKPARYSDILNASALFRLYTLGEASVALTSQGTVNPINHNAIFGTLQKVERLTAKALEVSYIQVQFNDWKGSQI